MAGQPNDRLLTSLLGWVAGYVDTAGFLGLNGLFTAHVTGNLVVAGAEVALTGGRDAWVRLAVIPVFVVAVLGTVAYWRSAPGKPDINQRHPSNLLWLEAISLLLFCAVSVMLVPKGGQPIPPGILFGVGSVGVFAMGVQNTLMREVLGSLAPTTVMTGNLTQFVMDLHQYYQQHDQRQRRKNDERQDERHDEELPQSLSRSSLQPSQQELKKRMTKFGSALLGFVVGAAMGALMMRLIGFWSIALPALTIALLAMDWRRRVPAIQPPGQQV